MNPEFFFLNLNQGNQHEVKIGRSKATQSELQIVRSKFKYTDSGPNYDQFWWYYDNFISEPIKQSDFNQDESIIWLNLNRFQKSLVAMNVMIWKGNSGGTFAILEDLPIYYFVIPYCLEIFELHELRTKYNVVKSYIEKHWGTPAEIEKSFNFDSTHYYEKYCEFIELHGENIEDIDKVFTYFIGDEFKNLMYRNLVSSIELNMNYLVK